MQQNSDEVGRWQLFKEELIRRFDDPRHFPTFVFYFAFVIIILAGVGWIIPLVMMVYYGYGENNQQFLSFTQSLSTYAIALAATSFVDLIISKDDPKIAKRPYKNTFSIVVMFGFVAVGALTLWTFSAMAMGRSFILAVIGTFLSWVIWWVANGDNAQSMEEPPTPTAATGGDPTQKAAGEPNALEGGLNQ